MRQIHEGRFHSLRGSSPSWSRLKPSLCEEPLRAASAADHESCVALLPRFAPCGVSLAEQSVASSSHCAGRGLRGSSGGRVRRAAGHSFTLVLRVAPPLSVWQIQQSRTPNSTATPHHSPLHSSRRCTPRRHTLASSLPPRQWVVRRTTRPTRRRSERAGERTTEDSEDT